MSETEKVGSELDPSDPTEEAKKLKLMEEISEMKQVASNVKKTLDETKKSMEEEKEEMRRELEKEEERVMDKYVEELNEMKQKVSELKSQREGQSSEEKESGKSRKIEPKSHSASNSNVVQTSVNKGQDIHDESEIPPNPPTKNTNTKSSYSWWNPLSWGKSTNVKKPTNSSSPRKRNPKSDVRKSLLQKVEKRPDRKKPSLFDSVGGISNQFRAIFEQTDTIQSVLLEQTPYNEWSRKDLQIWLNKIGMYQSIFPNFSKLEIKDVNDLERILREQNAVLFEGLDNSDRIKFLLLLFYAKHDQRYEQYHTKIISKVSKFPDYANIEVETLFGQFCLNLSDRDTVRSSLEEHLDFLSPMPLESSRDHFLQIGGGNKRMELKIVLMPIPLFSPPSVSSHLKSERLSNDDLTMSFLPGTAMSVALIVGGRAFIYWTEQGLVMMKRLGEKFNESQLVELARLELPSLHDFPVNEIVDMIVKWNIHEIYSPTKRNSVHFIDQFMEIVVGEMSSNLELLSVRYNDGASNEVLEPIRNQGKMIQLAFENKPIKMWSTLDLLTFYFILGTSKFFTTEFEFDLDGMSLFEADEGLLQLNLLDSKRMSFPEKVQFLCFHRVLMCLQSLDMRFLRRDIPVYMKFVRKSVRRTVFGTSQKFRSQSEFEVDDKGWFGGVGIVNMNNTGILPYLCSVERFESKFLSRFPLSETRIQILCLLEDHAYPIIPQKTSSTISHKKYGSSEKTKDNNNDDDDDIADSNNIQTKDEFIDPMQQNSEEFSKLMKFRSAILLNKSMLLEWNSDGLCLPLTRFYRTDPRKFEIMTVSDSKDLSHPDQKRKICELIVRYIRECRYTSGYNRPNDEMKVFEKTNNDEDELKLIKKNSQQFLDDFFKVCDWNVFGNLKTIKDDEEIEGESEEDEKKQEEEKVNCCMKILNHIRDKGYGIPIFEPSKKFIRVFDLPNLSFFDQYIIHDQKLNKKEGKQQQQQQEEEEEEQEKEKKEDVNDSSLKKYRVIFKTHEELDTFVIELLRDKSNQRDLSRFANSEAKVLKMIDRLFWHQYYCYERKGSHDIKFEMSKPKMKKIGFARKILPGMGTRKMGILKTDCLCPFGNPYDQAPKNQFKKRN